MDTRTKIIDASQAARAIEEGVIAVSGYFDPLTAAHAEQLESVKQNGSSLLVLINTPEDAILPAAARAELVAGLRTVDYVALMESGLTSQIRLEEDDDARRTVLIKRVHDRQSSLVRS